MTVTAERSTSLIRAVAKPGRPRVLLLRALGLGDFLTGVPAYRAVRRAFPEHEIVLAAPGQLSTHAELTGALDRLLPTGELEPVRWPWPQAPHVAVDLHGNGPASRRLLAALCPARLIGFDTEAANTGVPSSRASGSGASGSGASDRPVRFPGPRWRAAEHEVRRWCRLLSESGIAADPADLDLLPPAAMTSLAPGPQAGAARSPAGGRVGRWPNGYQRPVIVHPGAAFASRRWPAARFTAVAAHLDRAGRRVLVTGSASERELAESVAHAAGLPAHAAVAGKTTALNLASIVADAGLVICGDTGMAHLATALRCPSVVLFGPISPQQWGPPPERPWHVALHAAGPGYQGDPHGDELDPALAAIGAGEVIAAADELLGI